MSEGQKPTRPLLWQEEFLKLLAYLEAEYSRTKAVSKRDRLLRYHTLIAVGGFIGPRAKEFLNISWSDIVGKTEMDLYQFKVDRAREVHFNATLIAMVQANFTKVNPINLHHLVLHKQDEPMAPISTRQFNESFKRFLRKAKIDTQQPSSHTLRKTFVRHIWADLHNKSDEGLQIASKMVGHESTEHTRDYLGITSELMKENYRKM
ncbi:MAG: tyrosine-type recombinase/integrase [Reichenbachiella sp.]|uniref:tyrosine-type recombinase/integrase n=1 Tax=Reichenbachiella sp. TaxID=2184521 RepID=UPI00329A0A97